MQTVSPSLSPGQWDHCQNLTIATLQSFALKRLIAPLKKGKNLVENMLLAHKTDSISMIGLSPSNWPHFYSAHFIGGVYFFGWLYFTNQSFFFNLFSKVKLTYFTLFHIYLWEESKKNQAMKFMVTLASRLERTPLSLAGFRAQRTKIKLRSNLKKTDQNFCPGFYQEFSLHCLVVACADTAKGN